MKFHGDVKQRRIRRRVLRSQQAGRFSPDLANVTTAEIKLQPDERGSNQVVLLNSCIMPGDTGQQQARCASNPWEKSGPLLIYDSCENSQILSQTCQQTSRSRFSSGLAQPQDPGGPFVTLLRFFCLLYPFSALLVCGSVDFDPRKSRERSKGPAIGLISVSPIKNDVLD